MARKGTYAGGATTSSPAGVELASASTTPRGSLKRPLRGRWPRALLLGCRRPAHELTDEVGERLPFEHRADALRDRELDLETMREITQDRGCGEALDDHADLRSRLLGA